jgi:hypothetical protein
VYSLSFLVLMELWNGRCTHLSKSHGTSSRFMDVGGGQLTESRRDDGVMVKVPA